MTSQSDAGAAAIQADNHEHPDGLGGSQPADYAISFKSVSKNYLRNASRSLLRHRLAAWITRVPPERLSALKDISFDLRSGESLAVVGANGAGKSTLLRLATGVSSPDSGRVEVRGTMAALMELGA